GDDRRAGDRRRLVLREDDRVLGTDATARRATLPAVVGLLDEDRLDLIDAVHAKQAKIDALHAVGAAAVVDHWIPAAADFVRLRNADCGLRSNGCRLRGGLNLYRWTKRRVVCGGSIPLHLRWTRRPADPVVQPDKLHRILTGDPLHFVEVRLRS